MFRSGLVLCCVSLLAGCATHPPEAFHRLQVLPKSTVSVLSRNVSMTGITPASSQSNYQEWTTSPESLSRIRHRVRVQYVRDNWRSIKKFNQQVVDCIHDTQQRLSNGHSPWIYVAGKGYVKQTVVMLHAPACWSRLSTVFHGELDSAQSYVGSDNPLTRYDSALVHWTDFCQETAITTKGLNVCMASSWIQTIQLRKEAVSQYVSRSNDS